MFFHVFVMFFSMFFLQTPKLFRFFSANYSGRLWADGPEIGLLVIVKGTAFLRKERPVFAASRSLPKGVVFRFWGFSFFFVFVFLVFRFWGFGDLLRKTLSALQIPRMVCFLVGF